MSKSIPPVLMSHAPTRANLFALALEIKELLSNFNAKEITQELSESFALSEQEKAKREEYLEIIAKGEVLKKSLDVQSKSIAEKSLKIDTALNQSDAKLIEISAREELLKKNKDDLDSLRKTLDAKKLALNTREGDISTGEALLEDKKREHAQKESSLSIWEGKLQTQQNDIQSILNKMK